MKHCSSKQMDIIDWQRCYNVMKTHRAKLRVDLNNKDGLITQFFFNWPNTTFSTLYLNLYENIIYSSNTLFFSNSYLYKCSADILWPLHTVINARNEIIAFIFYCPNTCSYLTVATWLVQLTQLDTLATYNPITRMFRVWHCTRRATDICACVDVQLISIITPVLKDL